MNRLDGLERDLTSWFAESTSPRDPDLTDDVLWVTARTRQRPRWSFAERWLPTGVLSLGRRTVRPVPWRTVALVALLVVLAVAAAAVYVGTRPRLPAPYGLAANGLVAYAQNGDIYAVDPITGVREGLAVGPDDETEPRWSLDGTRVAFLRGRPPRIRATRASRSSSSMRAPTMSSRSRPCSPTSTPTPSHGHRTVGR